MTRPLPGDAIDAHIQLLSSDPKQLTSLSEVLSGASVSTGVLVAPDPSSEAVAGALQRADDSPLISGLAVWTDLASSDIGDALDRLKASPKVCSIAVRVKAEADNHWLVRDDVVRGLKAVAERSLALDVEIEPRQVPSVGRLAELVPTLRIVVDHIGSPFIARSEREPWGVYMLNVAPHRNVFVKVSGLVTLDTQPWKVAHHRLFVSSVVRLFGYERMMFGGDWPNHLACATYEEVVDAAYDATGPMTSRQADMLFRETAKRFYGLA